MRCLDLEPEDLPHALLVAIGYVEREKDADDLRFLAA